jgi:hypothetical protein
MTENQEFSIWMSRVEFYLESMVKKSLTLLKSYDYRDDFNKGFLPEETATRVIQRSRKWQRKTRG